ncbi:MAG: hypothetical protein Q9175_007307 [Cornicularia normoerica]
MSFPLPHHDDVTSRMVQGLLIRCKPATFGIDGRDALDEKYRKARKLDPSEFSTNFHPHDSGILDSVQQILLPSTIRGGQGVGIGPQGVRAERYNLNIYSAPSGKFLSHVDTPRGVLQFGSLVPSAFMPAIMLILQSGGELRVKHRGGTVDFAWGHTSPQSVQWAAFYGDCEHEVLEVTKGHRITLTYNLYYSSIGKLAQPVSNPHHLPLFDIAREMLLQQNFMRQGGILGFFCHHQYAHSQESGRKSIPGAFNGVDLAIFSVFNAFGLEIQEPEGTLSRINLSGKPRRDNDEIEMDDDFDEDLEEGTYYYDNPGHPFSIDDQEENTTIVGTKLHGPTFDGDYEESSEEYGNNAELNYQFSFAAILVVVPSSQKRAISHARPTTPHLPPDIPLNTSASPSTVVATPASSTMSTDDPSNNTAPAIPNNANPAAFDRPMMSSVPPDTTSFSTFNNNNNNNTTTTTSRSTYVADSEDSGIPYDDLHPQIGPPDDYSAGAGHGWEWGRVGRRVAPRADVELEKGLASSAVNAPPFVGSQYDEEWSSTGYQYGDRAGKYC